MMLKLLLVTFLITAAYADDAPLIEIPNGWLQGTLEKSYNGRSFSSFEGIPYARPPVGELRFQEPKEPYDWTGTWIANTKHTCIQTGFAGVTGDEDCLYINVYVPRTTPSESDNLNVIVHIHGGGFMAMSSHGYAGPKYLMDEDVILVTMNYRLSALGFLSTEDDVLPGNNGMKDQVLALKWIQKNIKYFGGNPDSITITGMSAGGASVHLHYFSPLSKGLFHRGVSQSGTALNPWTIQEGALQNAKSLAEFVGCPTETSTLMVVCLKSRSANEISVAAGKISFIDGVASMMFTPVVEEDHTEAFLTQQPLKMLENKLVSDVPWVVSVTKEEGQIGAAFVTKGFSEISENFEDIAPRLLMYDYINDDSREASITDKIKEYYFKESPSMENYITIIGDRLFVAGAYLSARLQAKVNKSPVYFYFLGYRGQHSFSEHFTSNTEHMGASHGDDVQYYLNTAMAEEILSESDEKMKAVFLQWLVAYADNQGPNIKEVTWEPVSGGEIHEYLYIPNPDEIGMDTAEDLGSLNFWSKLPLSENDNILLGKDEL